MHFVKVLFFIAKFIIMDLLIVITRGCRSGESVASSKCTSEGNDHGVCVCE